MPRIVSQQQHFVHYELDHVIRMIRQNADDKEVIEYIRDLKEKIMEMLDENKWKLH